MDKFDARILHALRRDGRISWVELAQEVNLSPSACTRRVQLLKAQGVIEQFTVSLNEALLGHPVMAFVAVSLDRQEPALAEEFREWVLHHARVRACHMLSGGTDYMLEVVATDLESFGRFLDQELLSLAAVKDATSSIVLGRVKSRFSAVDLRPFAAIQQFHKRL